MLQSESNDHREEDKDNDNDNDNQNNNLNDSHPNHNNSFLSSSTMMSLAPPLPSLSLLNKEEAELKHKLFILNRQTSAIHNQSSSFVHSPSLSSSSSSSYSRIRRLKDGPPVQVKSSATEYSDFRHRPRNNQFITYERKDINFNDKEKSNERRSIAEQKEPTLNELVNTTSTLDSRSRNKRMFAGLLSHLSKAREGLKEERSQSITRVKEEIQNKIESKLEEERQIFFQQFSTTAEQVIHLQQKLLKLINKKKNSSLLRYLENFHEKRIKQMKNFAWTKQNDSISWTMNNNHKQEMKNIIYLQNESNPTNRYNCECLEINDNDEIWLETDQKEEEEIREELIKKEQELRQKKGNYQTHNQQQQQHQQQNYNHYTNNPTAREKNVTIDDIFHTSDRQTEGNRTRWKRDKFEGSNILDEISDNKKHPQSSLNHDDQTIEFEEGEIDIQNKEKESEYQQKSKRRKSNKHEEAEEESEKNDEDKEEESESSLSKSVYDLPPSGDVNFSDDNEYAERILREVRGEE